MHYATSCCLMHWLLALFATGGDVPPAFLHIFTSFYHFTLLGCVSWAPGGLEPLRCQPFCRRNARASCACTCSRAGSRCPPMGRVPMWILFFLFTIYSVFFFKYGIKWQRFQSTESPWARQNFLVEVGPWRISSPFKLAFLCQLVTKRTSDASQCWNHSCQGIIKAVFTTLAISRFLCDLVATRGGDAWTSETPKVANPQDGAFWPPKNLSFYSDFYRELGASSTCF